MSVFRVEKTKGYTVMSNHHLRNHTLSLKAKGLLSQMLSLPDDWDYTLQGLAQINKESIDAIREAVRELERAGYIERSRERDERGCLRGTVYTIYEQPHAEPTPEKPMQALPTLDNPILEKPIIACQDSDYLWTDIILVHVGGGAEPEPSLSPEQKKPLSDLLATVADGNNKYYQSGDRYNGKSADTITDQKSGFWAQFTADKGPRANAQKVLETATTEEQINTAVTELKEAIDKLIPASQLNATYLYETLQTYQRSEGDLAQYTKTSGNNFRAARTAAQEYLDSLFDEKGDATAVNTSLNQQTANNKADALKQSWQNILALSKLTDAETNVKMIRALANRYTENKGYIRRCDRTPSGCADWRNRCSSFRSSGCAKHSHSWMRRSSGNRLRAGADCWNIPPKSRSYNYGRSHRWFHFWSDRKHRSTNGNRCWCRLRRFGSPAPMYGCRRKGRSRTHSCRRRAPCKRKCQDFLHNGTYNTRSTPDDLWMYASARRRCLAKNTAYSLGRCRQCRWTHGWKLVQALS